MKNQLASVVLSLLGLILLAGCERSTSVESAVVQPVPEPADLVFTGGKISTVDPRLGEQQALAVRGYQIVAVADDAAIAKHIGPKTQVIELRGRRVVPGFIEGHGHYMSFGQSQQILDLATAQNWDQIVGQVAVAVDSARPGAWILGRGWHQEKWSTSATELHDEIVEGVPVNDSLNVVSADNPVYLVHASGHAAYANAAALAAAGIGKNSPDPAGGTIVRRGNGQASGLLRENAQDAVEAAIAVHDQRLSTEERHAQMREHSRLAAQQALRHGVTSFHDAGAPFTTIDFLMTLEGEGALPVRLYVMVRGESHAELAKKLPGYRMVAEDNDFLSVRAIKRQIDGALGTHGAWLLAPYADMPNTVGLVLETVADIERSAELALEHGYQVNTHAIGTRANRETLDLYQRVWQKDETDGKALRWRVEHAQHIHPEDVP
ncbi:MAG: amidohydrolase, partial [Pseudomonadales bacterium]